MNSSFDSGGQFIWDSTSLKLATTCLRKYRYQMIDGWASLNPSPHLIFGGHYATALEHYHKRVALGESHDTALVGVIEETMVATWTYDRAEDGSLIPETGAPWQSFDSVKTRENLIRTIVWYLEEFGPDDSMQTYILSDGTPAVEYSFKVPLDHGFVYSGHIDRLVTYADEVYVTDNKTTKSAISPYFFRNFDLDIQMSGYTFAGRVIYDLPVKGVIIDAAQIAVGFTRFGRAPTMRSVDQLDEWLEETYDTVARARKAYTDENFPRNLTSCSDYGGCMFREVCSVPRAHRESFLRGNFEKRAPWNPAEPR